ncbi:hypothetical protein BC834DRAFT_395155 [Gloeopeniophorella convolvens]|nr:hypothetical protein BC834DRAFT_395155 [Gloeopeniophorella convolvens]
MCQADKVDPDTSEGYLVQRYADAILAIYDAAMANKEFGLQLFEGSCAALADTLEKAYRYFHEPETELPRPKQIDAADTKLFQEYVISASCNSDLNGALEKAAVALRTIDMMRTTKLTSFSETQQDGGTQRSRDQESRGRSGTITQQTVSMSFPLQAQKDARQALQAMRTSQVEALENDLARLRFFIWRVVNPVAKNELQAIVEEVLPHYHVHLVREDA